MAQRQFKPSSDTSTWTERFGNGSDGVFATVGSVTDSTANTSASGTLGNSTLSVGSATGFANGALVLIHQTRNGGDGAGVWELNKISSGGTTTSWTMSYTLTHNYDTTAQVYRLKQYSSVTITGGDTLTALDWASSTGGIMAFLCNGTITVDGNFNLDSKGYRGGSRKVNPSGVAGGRQGEGTAGARDTASVAANGNGGGGGDQSGSGGGNGAVGTAPAGSIGGEAKGNAALTNMVFGGGGGGGDEGGGGGEESGGGGIGGGALFLIAPIVDVSGSIISTGQGGEPRQSGATSGAGGGGAGGSIIIKCSTGTFGTELITALGGAGGTDLLGGGGAGAVGRIHADYGSSISGTTNPTLDSSQEVEFSTTTSTSSSTSTTSTSTSKTTSSTSKSTSKTTSTSRSTSKTTSTSTSTTVSMTTSTSTTMTSSSTSTTSTSSSTTTSTSRTTSSSTSTTSTSTTTTSTTITLPFHLDVDTGR